MRLRSAMCEKIVIVHCTLSSLVRRRLASSCDDDQGLSGSKPHTQAILRKEGGNHQNHATFALLVVLVKRLAETRYPTA